MTSETPKVHAPPAGRGATGRLPATAAGAGAGEALFTVGVLSDTHGHLYAEVRRALEGVEHIIHAGDIGSPQVLQELRGIASVTAVRGNCDYDSWAQALPLQEEVELAGARVLVGHVAAQLRERIAEARLEVEEAGSGPTGAPPGFAVVVTGHSHLAALEIREGTLHLNPGSAGPLRFGRPRTVARLVIRSARGGSGVRVSVEAELVEVDD